MTKFYGWLRAWWNHFKIMRNRELWNDLKGSRLRTLAQTI